MGNLGARAIAALIAVVLLVVVLASALFTVTETEQALVLRFGQIQGTARVEEGLHAKVPFVDNVVYLEKRILPLDLPPQEVIAAGQERLVVDAFARYRIVNPVQFYQAVGTVAVAESRLGTILNSAVRRVLGRSSFEDIVRDDRDALMARIEAQVAPEAEARFGLEVVDVRLRRADLPQQNSQRVFDRMRAQRVQEATQIRAQGEEAARRIRANSEREATVIVADAERDAQRIRGEGDATRNSIFAEAFNQDPDFFAFYRSMQAYEASLRGQGTRMVLSPDSDFFRYFNDLNGGFTRSVRNATSSSAAATGSGTSLVPGGGGVGASAETVIEAGGATGDDEAAPETEASSTPGVDDTVAPTVAPVEPTGPSDTPAVDAEDGAATTLEVPIDTTAGDAAEGSADETVDTAPTDSAGAETDVAPQQ